MAEEEIVAGEYMYYIYFNIGRIDYTMGSGSFKMVNVSPSKITGYDEKTLAFIYDLQGRPVKQLHKGKLYIGKDKFLVK